MKKKSQAQHHIFSQIRNPVSVKILIFANQHVNLKDYTFLNSCSNLVRLDLSQNAISHLPKEFLLSRLQRLKVLMLHHNQLVRLADIQAVFEVPQSRSIEYLTLFGNPLMQEPGRTRHYCINQMPQLRLFDEHIVVEEERSELLLPNSLFASCSPETFLKYPVVDMTTVTGTKQYMTKTWVERKIYSTKWLKCNPVIRVQRWVRRVLKRRREVYLRQARSSKRLPSQRKELMITEQMAEVEHDEIVAVSVSEVSRHKSLPPHAQNEKEEVKAMTVLTLLQSWHEFWRESIQHMGIQDSIGISGQLLARLQSKKPELLSGLTISKWHSLRFVRVDPFVSPKKKLLRYIVAGNMNSIVVRESKKVNRRRIIKFEQLGYIRKRNGLLTISERERMEQCSKMLSLLEKSYEEGVVQLRGEFNQLALIVRYILVERAQSVQPSTSFCAYTPLLLQRVMSVVKIQCCWRGYAVRKHNRTIAELVRHRAANRIQHWMRGFPFQHRLKFLKYLRQDLTATTGTRLIIHEPLYMRIAAMRSGTLLRLPFQNLKLLSDGDSLKLESAGEDRKAILPPYFDTLVIHSPLVDYRFPSDKQVSLYSILHTGAKVYKVVDGGRNLLMFQYATEETLRQRKLMLALKTYNFKLHFYIKCALNLNQERLRGYEEAAQKVYKLDIRKDEKLSGRSHSIKGQAFQPEAEGVFISANQFAPTIAPESKTIKVKFIMGKNVFEQPLHYYWKRAADTTLLKSIESSIRPSVKLSRHIIASPMLSPREGSSSILANSPSRSIPSDPVVQTVTLQHPSLAALQKFIAGSVSIETFNQQEAAGPFRKHKISGRYTSMEESISHSKSQCRSIEASEMEGALLESKRLKIAHSKQTKTSLKSLRISKRKQELRHLREAEAKEQQVLERQLHEQRRQQQENIIKQHDYIYQKLHGERRDQGTFESSFVQKGNYAIRYEFINKVRAVQSRWEKPKKVKTARSQTTEVSNPVALMRDRLLNRMPNPSKQTEHEPNEPSSHKPTFDALADPPPDMTQFNRKEFMKRLQQKGRRDKRQLVHSVFPEQFYPLRQDEQQQILILPRIVNK